MENFWLARSFISTTIGPFLLAISPYRNFFKSVCFARFFFCFIPTTPPPPHTHTPTPSSLMSPHLSLSASLVSGGSDTRPAPLKIASFNVQVFGITKMKKELVRRVLIKVRTSGQPRHSSFVILLF